MAVEQICPNCGHKGFPKKMVKGNILIEIILWFFMIVPGLIYSIWRLTTKALVCPQCNAQNMVALNSPRGKKLLEEYYPANA